MKPLGWWSFKIKTTIDLILPIITLFSFSFWAGQSIFQIITTMNIFSIVSLFPTSANIHASTMLNLSLLYLFNYFFFRTFLPGHLRVTRALLFTTIGIFFYDYVWSICSVTINSYGSFLVPLASFFVVVSCLLYTHNKQAKIFKYRKKTLIFLTVVYLVTLIVLILSGFFQQYALYEQGLLSVDPNSWIWLLNKTVTLWMWTGLALR